MKMYAIKRIRTNEFLKVDCDDELDLTLWIDAENKTVFTTESRYIAEDLIKMGYYEGNYKHIIMEQSDYYLNPEYVNTFSSFETMYDNEGNLHYIDDPLGIVEFNV
jgi:hypothetical protein